MPDEAFHEDFTTAMRALFREAAKGEPRYPTQKSIDKWAGWLGRQSMDHLRDEVLREHLEHCENYKRLEYEDEISGYP